MAFKANRGYAEDLRDALQNMIGEGKIVSQIYKQIVNISRRDDMDVILTDSDLVLKLECLTLSMDTFKTINDIMEYIASSCQGIYFNDSFNQYIEQIFYELFIARSKWMMGSFRKEIAVVIDGVME